MYSSGDTDTWTDCHSETEYKDTVFKDLNLSVCESKELVTARSHHDQRGRRNDLQRRDVVDFHAFQALQAGHVNPDTAYTPADGSQSAMNTRAPESRRGVSNLKLPVEDTMMSTRPKPVSRTIFETDPHPYVVNCSRQTQGLPKSRGQQHEVQDVSRSQPSTPKNGNGGLKAPLCAPLHSA